MGDVWYNGVMQKARKYWESWVDETKMAMVGIGMVFKRPGYTAIALAVWLFFAYILTLFRDGTSTWSLLLSGIGFGDKMGLMVDVWGRILGNFTNLWGWALMLMAMLQGLTVALLIFGWRAKVSSKATVAGLEAGGVGTALSFLALGCPSCGTGLLAPLLTTILGSGAVVMADVLGWFLVLVAVVLLLHAGRRLGYGALIEITARRHKNAKS